MNCADKKGKAGLKKLLPIYNRRLKIAISLNSRLVIFQSGQKSGPA